MKRTPKNLEATKKLMAALVRMPPKPHDEMKVKRSNAMRDKISPKARKTRDED